MGESETRKCVPWKGLVQVPQTWDPSRRVPREIMADQKDKVIQYLEVIGDMYMPQDRHNPQDLNVFCWKKAHGQESR